MSLPSFNYINLLNGFDFLRVHQYSLGDIFKTALEMER